MNHRIPLTLLTLALLVSLCLLPAMPVRAEGGDDASPAERALRETTRALGWPEYIAKQMLIQTNSDDDAMIVLWPPEDAVRFLARTKYTATNGGSYDDEDIQYARILDLGTDGAKLYLDKMAENGFERTSYQGRPAVSLYAGQEMCDAGGLVGYLTDWVKEWLSGIFGDSVKNSCASAAVGYIAWTCDDYVFVARDDTQQGEEEGIAQALYAAAEHQELCGLGDTLVILAETNDLAGSRSLDEYRSLAGLVNSYYGQTAYGEVVPSWSFLDPDGPDGPADWVHLSADMADFGGVTLNFATAALQTAYAGGAPQEEIDLARVIVVHAGPSQQLAPNAQPAPLQTNCNWSPAYSWHDITVGPEGNKSVIHASSLIVVGETDEMGMWAHEIGHSLWARDLIYGKYTSIGDRYNYQEPYGLNGDISRWGLMGLGVFQGDPKGSDPSQMIGFTRVAAGWLDYTSAELGEEYTLAALENGSGATVLQVDDPASSSAEAYYVVEARQAGGVYGAPETGVVIYKVSWDSGYKHHVVNNLNPQTGAVRMAVPGGASDHATLHTSDTASTVYRDVPAALEFSMVSEASGDSYSAVVSTNVITPTNLVGAAVTAHGAGPTEAPVATTNIDGPLPDIDLHAWDDQGHHVGLNYSTGEYERQIPGAEASGDLRGDTEWVYVPEGTAVRFSVSAEKTRQFVEAYPEYALDAPQTFDIEYGNYDAAGLYTIADGGKGEVSPGTDAPLSAPTDPSLTYKPAPAAHYGLNWPRNLPLAAFFAGILLLGTIGWITALARRR